MYLQTRCQDNDDDDIEGEQEEQAELDASLMEHAGDVIPQLAAAAPGQEFVAYFASLLPWFLKRMVSFRQWRVNIGARGATSFPGSLGTRLRGEMMKWIQRQYFQ